MAIVHVNFDVSAKVVKCEVLDVLIALCRRPSSETNQPGHAVVRGSTRRRERERAKLPP